MGEKVLEKWDVGGRRNMLINIYPCRFFFFLLVLSLPGLSSMTDMYSACPISNLDIDLHKMKDVLIHPNGGAVNLSITSKGCDFSFNTSFSQKEIEHYSDLFETYSFKSWAKVAFSVYSSGLYVYPKLAQLESLYTQEVILNLNTTRRKLADGKCLQRNSLRLYVSKNADVAHECKTYPKSTHTKSYTGSTHTYGHTYTRHVIWIPVGAIIVMCAACFRLCRLNCCPCLEKPRRQPVVAVREPQPIIRHGPTNFATPMPPPPPRYSDNTTASPPPYPDTTELPPPYPGHTGDPEPSAPNFWVPPSAKKHPTTTETDMSTINSSAASPSTSEAPVLPSDPASSSPVSFDPVPPSSASNDTDKVKPPLFSRFKDQFDFKRLQEE